MRWPPLLYFTSTIHHLAKRIARTCDLNYFSRKLCYKLFISIVDFQENQCNLVSNLIMSCPSEINVVVAHDHQCRLDCQLTFPIWGLELRFGIVPN